MESKLKRKEAKKRKIQAFLDLAALNDQEGRKRNSLAKNPKLKEANSDDLQQEDQLNSDHLQELQRKLRERRKSVDPTLHLTSKGQKASFDIPENLRTPLLFHDLQHFLLHALLDHDQEVKKWYKVEQWDKLTNTNVLVIDGIGFDDLNADVKSLFDHHLDFISPFSYNSNLAYDLSLLPMSISKTTVDYFAFFLDMDKNSRLEERWTFQVNRPIYFILTPQPHIMLNWLWLKNEVNRVINMDYTALFLNMEKKRHQVR